MVELTHMMH